MFFINSFSELEFGFVNDTITIIENKTDLALPLQIVSGRTEIPIDITFTRGDRTTAEEAVGMYHVLLFLVLGQVYLQKIHFIE